MSIPNDLLQTMRPRPYDAVAPDIRTGDLILCSGDGAFSRLIRWATKSPWSHIAIAVRLDPIDKVVVMESVEKIGARAVALTGVLARDSNGGEPTSPYPAPAPPRPASRSLAAAIGAPSLKTRRLVFQRAQALRCSATRQRLDPGGQSGRLTESRTLS